MSLHVNRCTAVGPEGEVANPNPIPRVTARMSAFLDSVPWSVVTVAKHGTSTPPRIIHRSWSDTQQVTLAYLERAEGPTATGLSKNADRDRAFKYHYISLQVIFSSLHDHDVEVEVSQKRSIKNRSAQVLRGADELESMWKGLCQAVVVPPDSIIKSRLTPDGVALTTVQADTLKADKKAARHVEDGNLSKAMSALSNNGMCDPTEQVVLDALQKACTAMPQLPNGGVELAIPHDISSSDEWDYQCGVIQVPAPGKGHNFIDVPTVNYAMEKLKAGIAPDIMGGRYEHYANLSTELVEKMVTLILNDRLPPAVRLALTSGRLIGLDKGDPVSLKVRPITIGSALVRLAAKIQCYQETPQLTESFLAAFQYGVGVKGGIELAYHATRLHMDMMIETAVSESPDPEHAPAVVKFDFSSAYNNASRGEIAANLQLEKPRMLRFFLFQYGNPSALLVVWNGVLIASFECSIGVKQGDVLGGHYFALGTVRFAEKIANMYPEVHISWIIDDLTLSGPQASCADIADIVSSDGPKYGLYPNPDKLKIWVHGAEPLDAWGTLGFESCPRGFDISTKLLGAPLGTDELMRSETIRVVKKLMSSTSLIGRIQNAHYEYVLLRYCLATKPMHLLRMINPEVHSASGSMVEASDMIRSQLERICSCRIGGLEWGQAQQPTRCMGLGLQNFTVIQEAAYAASHGAVARLLAKVITVHEEKGSRFASAAALEAVQAYQLRDPTLCRVVQKLADVVNTSMDDITQLCPSVESIATMPAQHSLSERLYSIEANKLITSVRASSRDVPRMQHVAWLRSCRGFNAGRRFDTVPSLQCFRTDSAIFRAMLRERLFLDDPLMSSFTQCSLCKPSDHGHHDAFGLRKVIHFRTQCMKCMKGYVHDRAKSKAFKDAYKSLGVQPFVEAGGLYTGAGDRPADLGIPGTVHETTRMLALDLGFADPCLPSLLDSSTKTDLSAADNMARRKMTNHTKAISELGRSQVHCDLLPVTMEVSGAFGTQARRWWEKFMIPLAKSRGLMGSCLSSMATSANPESARDPLLRHTWSANTWSTLTLQKIDWCSGVAMAEKTQGLIATALTSKFRREGLDFGLQ